MIKLLEPICLRDIRQYVIKKNFIKLDYDLFIIHNF